MTCTCMQAAYGDTAAYLADLSRQAAMYAQQTSHSMQEDDAPLDLQEEASSDAWIEVSKPLQFLVNHNSQVCKWVSLWPHLLRFGMP
jgi:hypothetical protein